MGKRHLPRSRRLRRNHRKGQFAAVRAAARRRRSEPGALRILGMGLMGSGKSTLLRALARVLTGKWLNQDEFYHLGRGARWEFLKAIRAAARDHSCGSLLVDKINTMRMHRAEILEALSEGHGAGPRPHTVLLRFLHPADPPGTIGASAVQLGLERIAARGRGHRSLHADNPELGHILTRTAGSFEAPSPQELSQFDAVIDVDITAAAEDGLRHVLAELEARAWLSASQRASTAEALASAMELERELTGTAERGRPRRLPLYWGVFFGGPTAQATLDRLRRDMHAGFKRVRDEHVTLLFAGRAESAEAAAQKQALPLAEFEQVQARCEELVGSQVKVSLQELVMDDDALCVTAAPQGAPCANRFPHVTLGHSERVGPVYSNELLAKAALDSGVVRQGLVDKPCLVGTVERRD